MATISKEEIYVFHEKFYMTTRVLRDGLFRITLPPSVAGIVNKNEVVATTQVEAIKLFKEAIKIATESKTTQNKVIIFKTNPETIFSKGVVVFVAAGVFIESATLLPGGTMSFSYKKLHHQDGGLPSRLSHNMTTPHWGEEAENKINWSQKAHDFFEQIFQRINGLRKNINEFLGDKEHLEKVIAGDCLKQIGFHENKN